MADKFASVHVFGAADTDQLKALLGGDAAVCQQNGCVSAFGGDLTIANIEQKAQMLSAHLSAPILFAASSGTTFLLGRCMMGFTVLRHCVGTPEADGVRESHAKSRDFCDQLHIVDHTDEIRRIVRERRVDSLAEKIEALIGIRFAAL